MGGQLDAIVSVEPAITALERAGDIAVVVETISAKGSNAVYGATLPSGCLYTKREFVRKYPNTVQALANAMVKALLWLKKAWGVSSSKAIKRSDYAEIVRQVEAKGTLALPGDGQ